jgi:hypothetical protein
MVPESKFVRYFYHTYQGRVALSAGYDQNLIEIYPLVFESEDGHAIGMVALATQSHTHTDMVHIYHLSAFKIGCGDGTAMLQELCCQADHFQIILSLSPFSLPNGDPSAMSSDALKRWYEKYGFTDGRQFSRQPKRAFHR